MSIANRCKRPTRIPSILPRRAWRGALRGVLVHMVVAVLLLVLFLGAGAAPWGSAEDWPLFRRDPQATGVASDPLPDNLTLLWKFPVKNGAFEGTPAIVGRVVYIGDLDGHLYALNLDNGEVIWDRTLVPEPMPRNPNDDSPKKSEPAPMPAGFMASPAVRDGKIYLGDIDGVFHCVDAKTGDVVWSYATQAEIDSCANFYKDRVIFGSQDATLYCLNTKDGEVIWKYKIDDQIRCSPTIVDNRAFVAGCDSKLHSIDLDIGSEVSFVPIEAPTGVTPGGRGDHVFVGTEAGAFFCINFRDSSTTWTYRPDTNAQSFRSSPAIGKDRVVFGGRNKRVTALDFKTGELKWEFPTRNRVDSSPVIVGKRVYVGSADGRIYGLNLETGKQEWIYEGGGGFSGSAAVANGRLVIANDRGVVFCFGAK